MSGLDKIKEAIKAESDANVSKTISEAEKKAQEIRAEILAEADREVSRIAASAQAQVSDSKERTASAVDLEKKRALLFAKQEIISETIDAAREKLLSYPDDKYFDGILSLVKKNARPQAGEISFSSRDLGRLPSGFETRLQAALPAGGALTVSKEAVDIDGGFILSYGGALENCSISALFEDSREELCDKVRKLLFA